jgi:hypothetical protein
MNKLLFLFFIVVACSLFGNMQEGMDTKGIMGLRQYIPIPQQNTGPFMHSTNHISYSDYEGHNQQI